MPIEVKETSAIKSITAQDTETGFKVDLFT